MTVIKDVQLNPSTSHAKIDFSKMTDPNTLLLRAAITTLDNTLNLDSSVMLVEEGLAKGAADNTAAGKKILDDELYKIEHGPGDKPMSGTDLQVETSVYQSLNTGVSNLNEQCSTLVNIGATAGSNLVQDASKNADFCGIVNDNFAALTNLLSWS